MMNIEQAQAELQGKKPHKILCHALENYDKVAIAFSGAEDVVLIDMSLKIRQDVQVFFLDTGRLHPETYRFIEQVRKHYKMTIELLTPDYKLLQDLVNQKGLFSFYEEGHKECCNIRKVAPLKLKLAQVNAWISGQRKDQSMETRQNIPEIQVDPVFVNDSPPLIKFNPLVNQSSAQIWDYIKTYQVPFNTLHEQGYISIGCEPCTRPVLPNQHERTGRWWWEEASKKECGLHSAK